MKMPCSWAKAPCIQRAVTSKKNIFFIDLSLINVLDKVTGQRLCQFLFERGALWKKSHLLQVHLEYTSKRPARSQHRQRQLLHQPFGPIQNLIYILLRTVDNNLDNTIPIRDYNLD